MTSASCSRPFRFQCLSYNLSHVLYGAGYQCLGKGKCPSSYHNNHRDHVMCPGHDGRNCWKPSPFGRFPVPDGWPEAERIDIGEGQTVTGGLLACLHTAHDGAPFEVCPTCKGVGTIPNPDGSERFDLVHTDGYALRHRWL